MITSQTLQNNVRSTLFASISSVDTEITLNQAASPWKDPPTPSSGSLNDSSVLTLTDSLTSPTKIEIINYESVTDNGDGTITLNNCSRGRESTVASAFSAGDIAFQAITVATLSTPLINFDHEKQEVDVPGPENTERAAMKVGGNGVRVPYSNSIQVVVDCATTEHEYDQRNWALVDIGGDFGFMYPPAGSPSDQTRFPFLISNDSGYANGSPITRTRNIDVERLEMLQAARLRPSNLTAFDANSTIDWKEHDIRLMNLTSNSVVTMTDTSDYIVPGGEYRRLILLISLPNVANPGYTITWPSNVKWAGGTAPTFNTGQNQIRKIEFLYNGTYYLGSAQETFQL